MVDLSLGNLVDIVGEEWMRDTLPDDDLLIPPLSDGRPDEAEELSHKIDPAEGDVWHDLALDNNQ